MQLTALKRERSKEVAWITNSRLRLRQLEQPSAFKTFISLSFGVVIFPLSFVSVQQARMEEEETQRKQAHLSQEDGAHASTSSDSKKPRIKKSAYFSDEEELSD